MLVLAMEFSRCGAGQYRASTGTTRGRPRGGRHGRWGHRNLTVAMPLENGTEVTRRPGGHTLEDESCKRVHLTGSRLARGQLTSGRI
jgi:hypothetical protein